MQESWYVRAKQEFKIIKKYLPLDTKWRIDKYYLEPEHRGLFIKENVFFSYRTMASIFFDVSSQTIKSRWGVDVSNPRGIIIHHEKLFECLSKYAKEHDFEVIKDF